MSNLNYSLSGKSGADCITLSHSLATTKQMWSPQLSVLEERFQVLRYDTRGHGGTPRSEEQFTIDDLAQDVVDLWNELDIETSHFMGLSLGGMTGIGLALNFPERLKSLIACDCRADAPTAFHALWDQRIALVSESGLEAIIESILDTWISDRSIDSRAESQAREHILNTDPAAYLDCALALKTLNYKHRLGDIYTPTLYVVGENDGPHPTAMEEMTSLTPGAKLVTLKEAAHLANLEQPIAFNEAVLAFLSR